MRELKDVSAKMYREGTAVGSLRPVNGTWASTLGAATTQAVEVSQLPQHTFQRDLAAEVGGNWWELGSALPNPQASFSSSDAEE